ADVRMSHLPRGPDLGVELREPLRVVGEVGRQELEPDRLPEAEVVSAIDLAHAPAAEQTEGAIAAVEDRSGREAAVVDRAGRGEPAGGAARRAPLAGRLRARGQPRRLLHPSRDRDALVRARATGRTEAAAGGNGLATSGTGHNRDSRLAGLVGFQPRT